METKIDLSIKTIPVEIKVLTVDGKRMTLSVFRQIPEYSGPYTEFKDGVLRPIVHVLGWCSFFKAGKVGKYMFEPIVHDVHKWIILSKDGVLFKCSDNRVLDYWDNIWRDGGFYTHEELTTHVRSLFNPENQIYISI